ncbi:MAG: TonB-dependent receptor, partial [Flavobacteriales bacterium]|nr:TonB-dependent receptor [Flavobacteriales bacterium]
IPGGTAINPENGETVISFENANDVNPNPDLKWEENAELNIGIDFGLWRDRISGSLEYYNKTTRDLIYRYELPVPPNRNRFIYANAGEIKNQGIEATIQAFVLNDKDLSWKSVLTFARNKQETVSLSNDLYDLDEIRTLFVSGRGLVGGENWTQLIRPGFEIGTFYMPEYAGLSEDGEFLFFTASGGVTRDVTLAERRVVGNAQPDFIIGWSNYFTFGRNWDASFALRAVVGHDILNVTRMVFSNPSDLPTLNTLGEAIDEFDRGLDDNPTISDYYLEDGTFLKMDNAAIGYTLNTKESKNIKSMRFYIMANNLFVLTGYEGIDPEVSFGGLEFGRDQYDVYPKTRSITVGVNAVF